MDTHRIYKTSVASVYRHYLAKVEKKGRSREELDSVIRWLTGHDQAGVEAVLEQGTDFETFFAEAPGLNPAREAITGTICRVKIQELAPGTMREIRTLDKSVDELAKGRPMAKILRG